MPRIWGLEGKSSDHPAQIDTQDIDPPRVEVPSLPKSGDQNISGKATGEEGSEV